MDGPRLAIRGEWICWSLQAPRSSSTESRIEKYHGEHIRQEPDRRPCQEVAQRAARVRLARREGGHDDSEREDRNEDQLLHGSPELRELHAESDERGPLGRGLTRRRSREPGAADPYSQRRARCYRERGAQLHLQEPIAGLGAPEGLRSGSYRDASGGARAHGPDVVN